MAKIAVDLERAVAKRRHLGIAGTAHGHVLASGPDWNVSDIVCTSGPQDRAFEECHSQMSIAMVISGSFQYRNSNGRALLIPGSLLLGNAGQCFECSHEYAAGDRCISFKYDQECFESIAADAGIRCKLDAPCLPPIRDTSGLVVRACAGVAGGIPVAWEELSLELAMIVLRSVGEVSKQLRAYQAGAAARVTKIARMIEQYPASELALGEMARAARLSPYHFLRVFQEQTGLTPHQFIMRTRLRNAATRLAAENDRILDVALDCGFGDVSNFNRAFRTEFGANPRAFRNDFNAL